MFIREVPFIQNAVSLFTNMTQYIPPSCIVTKLYCYNSVDNY